LQLRIEESRDFSHVFDAQFDFVWRSLIRMGCAPADAEDLTQEVFVVVHRRLSAYDHERSLRAWLFGIARNVLRDHSRLARVRREVIDDEHEEARSDPRFRALEAGSLVRRALLELPEPLRAIVLLHDLEEVEMRAAAHALELPLDTAYARLRRGRETLRDVLSKMQAEVS
jgi:RNA polymerase sigma-70 factor, ECF subfamily